MAYKQDDAGRVSVHEDVTFTWDGDPILVQHGTLVAIVPGSTLETAYGGAGNVPQATRVQIDAANGGIASGAWQSN